MKKICLAITFVITPFMIATVLQPSYDFSDLILKQQLELKQFNDQLDKKYAAVLVRKNILERDNDYAKAKADLYAQYRKKTNEGAHTFDHDLDLLIDRYSPGLAAELKSYNTELAEGKQRIGDKYAQMRKMTKNNT